MTDSKNTKGLGEQPKPIDSPERARTQREQPMTDSNSLAETPAHCHEKSNQLEITSTIFSAQNSINGSECKGTWAELVQALQAEPEESDSKDGEAFLFGEIKPDREGKRRHRKEQVVAIGALSIDVDDKSDEAVLDALNELRAQSLEFCGWPSHSQLAKPKVGTLRCRLVLPLSRPVDGIDWPRFWPASVQRLGLEGLADPKCCDSSRLYFHTVPPGKKAEFAEWCTLLRGHGAPLPVDEILASAPETPTPPGATPTADLNRAAVVDFGVRVDRCPRGTSPFVHAETLCRTMPPAIAGQGGHVALLRVARALVWGLRLPVAQCTGLIAEIFNPRCVPPWTAEEIAHKVTDASAPEGASYAAGILCAPEPSDVPEIIGDARGTQFWIHKNQGEYFSPVAKGMLPARAIEANLECAGSKAETIAARAVIAEQVARDFTARGVRWEGAERTVVQGYAPPQIAPVYDARADAWLRTLTGDRYAHLAEWFASCQQKFLGKVSACLVLIGDTGIGKSLIGLLAARMWGESKPVPLGDAVDKFNATIAKCPIVFDDEAARLKRGDVSTADFREMISARERTYEPKGIDKRKLIGAQRFGVTANSPSDLRFSDLGGPQVVEALGDRLLVIQCGAAREALAPLRLPDSDDVDLDAIDRHVAWIATNTQIKPQRFLASAGAHDPEAMRVITRGVVDRAPELFDAIEEAIDAGEFMGTYPGAAFVKDGVLWVRGSAGGVTMTSAEVFGSLGPWELRGPNNRQIVKINGAVIRARPYDTAKLSSILRLG